MHAEAWLSRHATCVPDRAVSRDPKKLRVFHDAHGLVVAVFTCGDAFPPEQRFVIRQQLYRAVLSIVCNLVEGCARRTVNEYRHFVRIALGSAREAAYLIDLSGELSYLPLSALADCRTRCKAVVGSLQNLTRALESIPEPRPKQGQG
jgi:four helix bundle protein